MEAMIMTLIMKVMAKKQSMKIIKLLTDKKLPITMEKILKMQLSLSLICKHWTPKRQSYQE